MHGRTLRRAAALLVVGLAAPAAAFGQNFGVKAGANSAKLDVTSTQPLATLDPRIGGVGGIYGTKRLGSVVSLEMDLLVALKGANATTDTGASFSFSYFTVPVLGRVKISGNSPVRVFLVGGPEFGYRVHAKLVNGGDSIAWDDFVKIYDLGGTAGGAAEFGRFSFDIRYTRGLVNVARNIPGLQVKNRTVTALFGVALRTSK